MAPLFEESAICCDSSFGGNSFYSPKKLEQQPQQAACSSSVPATIETKPLHSTVSKSDDAFLYYSNDEIRIKAMKLQHVPETVHIIRDINQRKTKLSFEVDALTAMEDLLDDIYLEEEFDMGELIVDFPSKY